MFTGDKVSSGPVDWSFEIFFSKPTNKPTNKKQNRLSVSSVVLLLKRTSRLCDALFKNKRMRSAMTCSKFDFWILFRRPWFIKALSRLSSLCWNPLKSSDALTSNFSSLTWLFLLHPASDLLSVLLFFLLSYLISLIPPTNRQAIQIGTFCPIKSLRHGHMPVEDIPSPAVLLMQGKP